MTPLGLRLQAERDRLGHSQRAFAELLGASKSAVTGWEVGRTVPNGEALVAMAALGLDVQYVLTGVALPVELRETYRLAAVHSLGELNPALAEAYIQSLPSGGQLASGPESTVLTARETKMLGSFRRASEDGKTALEQAGRALAKKG